MSNIVDDFNFEHDLRVKLQSENKRLREFVERIETLAKEVSVEDDVNICADWILERIKLLQLPTTIKPEPNKVDYGVSCGRHYLKIEGLVIAQTPGDDMYAQDHEIKAFIDKLKSQDSSTHVQNP